jgi:hypothetical protein
MTQKYFKVILTGALLILATSIVAAQTVISFKGIVKDAKTGRPIAFAAVELLHTTDGAYTDTLGQFAFTSVNITDSLRVTYLGYQPFTVAITRQPQQIFDVELRSNAVTLGEMVFTGDANPGRSFMKKVIARNRENDPSRFQRIDARRWTRAEVSALDPKVAYDTTGKKTLRGGLLLGGRVKVFDKVHEPNDSSRGKIPLFFAEKIADYTLTNDPFVENLSLLAVKTTNLASDKLFEWLARWDAGSINLYKQRVLLFAKSFVSPVGIEALGFYDFYFQDSVKLSKKHWLVTLQVIPKVWYGNVFTGTITVEDSSFALIKADLHLSKDANINFIEYLDLDQSFSLAPDLSTGKKVFAPRESILGLSFESGPELLGLPIPSNAKNKRLISRMTAFFDTVRVNDPNAPNVKPGALTIFSRSIDTGASDEFWKKNRPDTLTPYEESIYEMANILRHDPKQMIKDKFLALLNDGNYYFGNYGYLGPVGSILSNNQIEGTRLRLGFMTLQGFSSKVSLYGHIAYGTKDQRWKGGLGIKYLWTAQPYTKTQLYLGSDYSAFLQWGEEPIEEGFATAALRKNVPFFQIFQRRILLTHDQQIGTNWFFYGSLGYRSIDPSFDFTYPNPKYDPTGSTPYEPQTAHAITVAEASVGLRYAWQEKVRIYEYERYPQPTKFPTASVLYTRGIQVGDAHFPYDKFNFTLTHTSRITPKALLYWRFDAGKVYGVLPSLLLQVPQGNNSYVIQRSAFNTMVPFEFAADRFLSLKTRFSLGGILLDRIPYLQKLGWRERLTFNSFWGDLTPANRKFNSEQHLIEANQHPFAEAGIGIENIFHILSIDYIRRLNYLNSPNLQGNTGGVFLGMKAVF